MQIHLLPFFAQTGKRPRMEQEGGEGNGVSKYYI